MFFVRSFEIVFFVLDDFVCWELFFFLIILNGKEFNIFLEVIILCLFRILLKFVENLEWMFVLSCCVFLVVFFVI